MERLGPLDSMFLSIETSRWPMHLTGVLVLEPGETAPLTYEHVKQRVAERLPRLAPMRRRLVDVPFGLDRAYWVEDPEFDLDRHFHHAAVPDPGAEQDVARFVSRIADHPLDRSKPLWECWFLEGLEGGRKALVLKIHHACIDGIGGLVLFDELFDPVPGREPEPVEEAGPAPSAEPIPSDLELLARSVPDLLLWPFRSAWTAGRIAVGLERARHVGHADEAAEGETLRAPRTVFNGDVPGRAHRAFAVASVGLDEVRAVKDAFGTTVNDVVLALVAGALRRFLGDRDELPEESLIVANPVSLRPVGDDTAGNKLSLVFPRLRTDVADPVERLEAVHGGTVATKAAHRARGQEVFEQVAGLFSPGFVAGISQLYGAAHLARRHGPLFNGLVSNVAGPEEERFLCGARVDALYGVALLYEGIGLFIALLSHAGRIDFSITGAQELTPDLWPLADGLRAELDLLLEAAAERSATSA